MSKCANPECPIVGEKNQPEDGPCSVITESPDKTTVTGTGGPCPRYVPAEREEKIMVGDLPETRSEAEQVREFSDGLDDLVAKHPESFQPATAPVGLLREAEASVKLDGETQVVEADAEDSLLPGERLAYDDEGEPSVVAAAPPDAGEGPLKIRCRSGSCSSSLVTWTPGVGSMCGCGQCGITKDGYITWASIRPEGAGI